MKTRDVIISGGGIPGLTLAALLGHDGFSVTVLEPAALPRPADVKPTGRTSALMEDSIDILEQAGIWSKVEKTATDLRILAIIDDTSRTDFTAAEMGKPRFGANIQNALLQSHAAAVAQKIPGVTIIQAGLHSFVAEENFVTAELSDGQILRAPLLIGADGRNSAVRRGAGIECRSHDYEQMAITALLTHTKPHNFTSTEFHLPGGPFTLVPMPGKTSSLVWVEHADAAEKLLRLKKKDFEQVLQDRSQGILGELSLQTNPEAWPLKLMSAKAFTGTRIALIAEAAHVLSPIGAQGLNLSLRDAFALYQQISTARSFGLDHGSAAVLAKFAKERGPDTAIRVAGTHSLNQMVATDHPVLTRLRRLGFQAVSNLAPLRSLVMDQGLNPGQASASGRTTRAKVKTSTR